MLLSLYILMALFNSASATGQKPQITLIDLQEAVKGSVCEPRYAGTNNFIGRPIPGYYAHKCMGTPELAAGLSKAQAMLDPYGFSLIIYDAYRPQRAVNEFVRWTRDTNDLANKQEYYPDVAKNRLIADGYIADKSGHSRGGTVDLSLIDSATGEPLDMGTPFDYFSPQSSNEAKDLTREQRANRLMLRSIMEQAGLVPYYAEWWHFRLADEPWPETYFDLVID